MHAVDLIATGIPEDDPDRRPLPCEPVDATCAVTGAYAPCVPRKHVIKSAFTNHDLLRCPDSGYVSVHAYTALTYKWERMSSWIATPGAFRRLDRVGVRNAVFGPEPRAPWAGYATTSYKKHGSLWVPVNGPGQRRWRFESVTVDLSNADEAHEVWTRLNEQLRAGYGRAVLETLDCPPWLLVKGGVKRWIDFEVWARPRYRGPLYQFLCYLLPSQEELRQEAEHAV